MATIPIYRTKRGFPALWEEGGGMTSTGHAQIVAGQDGEKLRPIYVKRRGHLAVGQHALFVLRPGMHVIRASQGRGDFWIEVSRITEIQDDTAVLEALAEFSEGQWDTEPSERLQAAIEAAKKKATCYHCRSPHYAEEVRA